MSNDPIAALKQAYAPRLVSQLQQLRQMIEQLPAVAAASDVEPIRALAHRVHGTAGSYGFAAASALAKHIELSLDEQLAGDSLDQAGLRGLLGAPEWDNAAPQLAQ